MALGRTSACSPVRIPVFDSAKADTPLIRSARLSTALGLTSLYVKDESTNATGSFKARGLAVAIARAVELGLREFVIPTAGNAGGALAASRRTFGNHSACLYAQRHPHGHSGGSAHVRS